MDAFHYVILFRVFGGRSLQADKQEQHGRSFLEEADNLRGMNHPNVLRFYGRVLDHENRVVGIITEYMKGGSLSALVRYGQVLPAIFFCPEAGASTCAGSFVQMHGADSLLQNKIY